MLSRPASLYVLLLSARPASLWALPDSDNFIPFLSSMTGIFDSCTALRISQGCQFSLYFQKSHNSFASMVS